MSAPNSLAPRRAALSMLHGVLGEGRLLFEVDRALKGLEPADKARAQRLASQVLRDLGRADVLLSDYVSKMPPEPVLDVLRLGTVELCANGEAAHGVVNDAVSITGKIRRAGHLKGLVNAVLRKVARDGPERWATMTPTELPDWLRFRLMRVYGRAAVEQMEAVFAQTPPLDFTAKPGVALEGAVVLPTGQQRLERAGQVSALPGFETGDWWVQDAAAALPVICLDPQPGQTALDICAAPGGKTLQLAQAGAKVRAVDISEPRMERLRENLARTGLKADVHVGDAIEEKGTYDLVVLDAPCSATGTIRRHPDLPYAKSTTDFKPLLTLQMRLLRHAAARVAPGGKLLFCTCSLLPQEGEDQIAAFVKDQPKWQTMPETFDRPGIDASWRTPEGGLRLRPDYWADQGGMDGFYIAVLQKHP
ncbi:MAG: transcription antitermination factor NusB [Pseudomonadota bacterium]